MVKIVPGLHPSWFGHVGVPQFPLCVCVSDQLGWTTRIGVKSFSCFKVVAVGKHNNVIKCRMVNMYKIILCVSIIVALSMNDALLADVERERLIL